MSEPSCRFGRPLKSYVVTARTTTKRGATASPVRMSPAKDSTAPIVGGVVAVLAADIYKLLVERDVLTQGDAVARLERLSFEIGQHRDNPGYAVMLIDVVRNSVANEQYRRPS